MNFLVVVISGGPHDGRQAGLPIGLKHGAKVNVKGQQYTLDRNSKKLNKN